MRVKNSLFLTLFVLVGFMNATPMWAGDCVPPPPGLVSWWPGDGNACDIVGPNNGILHGGVTFEKGMVGEAFRFDGEIGSFVEAATVGLPIGIQNRTIEMWVRFDAHVSIWAPLAEYGNRAPGQYYQLEVTNLSVYAGIDENAVSFSQWGNIFFGPTIEFGTWHHVAATNIGSFVTIYLDGILVARTGDFQFSTPSNTRFLIGGRPIGSPLSKESRFNGLADEVSVYNHALTHDEIYAIYAAGSAGKCKEE